MNALLNKHSISKNKTVISAKKVWKDLRGKGFRQLFKSELKTDEKGRPELHSSLDTTLLHVPRIHSSGDNTFQ